MNTSSDIWFAFARTFSMLFLVLAVALFAFFLVKKFSTVKGAKGRKDFIKVLSIHHLSPKEKLVLLNVLGDTLLIGVTPVNISKLGSFEKDIDFSSQGNETISSFSDFLTQKLGSSLKNKGKSLSEKGER